MIVEDLSSDSEIKLGAAGIAAELSHALKNPFGAIIAAAGLVSAAGKDKLSQDDRELLDKIESVEELEQIGEGDLAQ